MCLKCLCFHCGNAVCSVVSHSVLVCLGWKREGESIFVIVDFALMDGNFSSPFGSC